MARVGVTAGRVGQAAVELADAEGLAAVTVSALARRLGVRPASMYAHVSGIDDVREGLHRRALGQLADEVGESIAGRSGGGALAAQVAAHRRFAADHPGLWEALQQRATEATMRSPDAVRIAGLGLAVLRGYGLEGADAVHASRLVGATVNGFLALEASGSFDARGEDREMSWGATVDALDRALSSWPGAGTGVGVEAGAEPQG